jgi:PilZ domain
MIGACQLKNISATGAKLVMDENVELPPTFLLSFSLDGVVRRRCSVIWRREEQAGIQFEPEPLPLPLVRRKKTRPIPRAANN